MSGTDSGQMRVSDAERERVAARLTEAHGEGRLTLAEFDERVRAAHGATVRADLEPLVVDLPERGRPVGTGSSDTDDGHGGRRRHGGRPGRRDVGVPVPPLPFAGPPMPFAGLCGAGGWRGAVTTWAVVSLINVVIWVAVVVGSGTLVHPWWIWVAGPWGVALLLGAGLRHAAAGSTRAQGVGALPGR